MSPQVCPNEGELTRYCLGSLPVEQIDEVADHLETCTSCSSRLTDLFRQSDPLAEAVRQAGRVQAYLVAVTPPTTLRDYRIEGVLGEGGMGTVYRAMHTRLGRPVALKLLTATRRLDPDASARFEREMRAIGALRHPNIVQATDAGEVDGVPFLVMELLDGRDLGRLVSEQGTMEVPEACEVIRQAAFGLQHAHEHGLVHRDVKPSNVMVTSDGTVKLLDLGLARNSATTEFRSTAFDSSVAGMSDLTDPHMRLGTERYMAPEQRTSPELVGPQADVYALGRTLCYLLHGSPDLSQVGSVPIALHSIVQRMQAESPADRFQSASAVAEALQPWCPGQKIAHRTSHGRRRSLFGLAVAVALIVSMGATIAIMRLPRDEAATQPNARPSQALAKKNPPKTGQLGMTTDESVALQKEWASFLVIEPFVQNAVGMKLAVIPPGELNTSPVTHVKITKPYLLGMTEVTRAQFRDFVTKTGHRTMAEKTGNGIFQWYLPTGKMSGGSRQRKDASLNWAKPGHPDPTEDEPASQVSWHDAVAYCIYLSGLEEKQYRLPTYSELAWAARAGSSMRFPGGTAAQNDATALENYACTERLSPKKPYPVGKLKANSWGLCDTIGNVAEWSSDWWGEFSGGTFEDYTGPKEGMYRMTHGASHVMRAGFEVHGAVPPDWSSSTIGFRVLRDP